MADLLPPVVAELKAKIDEFRAGMKSARGDMDETEKSGSRLKSAGHAAAAGFAVLGTAAVAFGGSAVKAALEGEKAHSEWVNAIKNSGAPVDDMVKRSDKMAGSFAKLGYENDELEQGLTRLTQATNDPAKAMDNMALVADLAKAKHISLEQAATLVGKVMNGNVGVLGRMGIATKDASGHTLDAAAALKLMHDRFGGSASADANTYLGRVSALKAQFANWKEEIGNKLIPILAALGNAVQSTINFFEQHRIALVAVAVVVGTVVVGALTAYVAGMVSAAAASLAALPGMITAAYAWAASTASAAASTALAFAPVIAIAAAIAALAAGVIYAYNHFSWFKTTVDAVAGFLKDTVWPILKDVGRFIGEVFSGYVHALKVEFDVLKDGVELVWSGIHTAITWAWENVIGPVFGKVKEGVGDIRRAFESAKDGIETAWNAVFGVVKSVWNKIADLWNAGPGAISIHIPSWVPEVGGKGFDMPQLPHLAGGSSGVLWGGWHVVGEHGPELARLPIGTQVASSGRQPGAGGSSPAIGQVHQHFYGYEPGQTARVAGRQLLWTLKTGAG